MSPKSTLREGCGASSFCVKLAKSGGSTGAAEGLSDQIKCGSLKNKPLCTKFPKQIQNKNPMNFPVVRPT